MYFAKTLLVFVFINVLSQFQCQDELDEVFPIWPDLSCRNGYAGGEDEKRFTEEYNLCGYLASPGPNTPEDEYNMYSAACKKFCMLVLLGTLDGRDLKDEETSGNGWRYMNFTIKSKSEAGDFFDDISIKKIHAQCADLFQTVFYAEMEACDSSRANDVYDCVQDALKC